MRPFRPPVIANPESWRRAQAEGHAKAHAIPYAEQAQAGMTGQVMGIGGMALELQTDKATPLIGQLGRVEHQLEGAHGDSPTGATATEGTAGAERNPSLRYLQAAARRFSSIEPGRPAEPLAHHRGP